MRVRLRILMTIAAAVALALSLASCGAKAPIGITVTTASVAMGRLVEHVEFSGVLAPSQTATISSRLSGLAKIVAVDIGSRVKAGELLVKIDTRELSAQSDVAEAALQLVRDQAAQAKTGIETAKANLDLAQKTSDRAAALITNQSITQGQFDDAKTKLELAKTAYENATQQYELLSSSSLAQAQAQANLIRVQISHGVITSPIAGVVTNRNVNPGEVVSANTQLMSIVDSSLLKLQGNVAQSIATLLTSGEKVNVSVDGMRNGEYEGAITQVGPVAAATGQFFPLVVSVKNDGRLMAGMTALSSFDLPGPPTLLIPLSAITSSNGRAYAFVVSNGTAARRALRLGLESATQVEILGGLSTGDVWPSRMSTPCRMGERYRPRTRGEVVNSPTCTTFVDGGARRARIFRAMLLVVFAVCSSLHVAAQVQAITVEQAVKIALDNSWELRGASWDLRSAQAQALAQKLKMIPSITLGGTYTHLSDTPAANLNVPAFPSYLSTPLSFTLPPNFGNQTDAGSLVVRLQYPIFAGFRLQEATRIAELKSTSRAYAIQITERAIIFEVRRAYWEVMRADSGAAMLAKNLSVMDALRQDVRAQQSQGLATEADLMNADQQYENALLSLMDAAARRGSAYLALASILGQDAAGSTVIEAAVQDMNAESPPPYQLVSDPAALPAWAAFPSGDLNQVVSQAMAARAETRLSALSTQIAEHAVKVAQAGIYPTLSLFGDYSYADPNSRILVSAFGLAPGFYGTWEVGVQLSYELGELPTTLAQAQAAEADVQKAQSEAMKQSEAVVLDVRSALLSLQRTRAGLETVRSMVKQAEENLRVQQDKQHNGVARQADVLSAELSLVQSQYAVTGREIDLQIAAADFARAAAVDPLVGQR